MPPSTAARQFLVRSLRAFLAGEKTPSETPLAAADWASLVPLAEFHSVAPLLARALQAGVASAAPDSVRDALAAAAQADASRSLLLTAELARLLKQLDAGGIPAIPDKGPTLAALLYGDPALRHYSDLDILVQPQDLPAAKQAALALGYQPGSQDAHHAVFYLSRGRSEIKLELHWNIMREDFPLRMDLEGVWERCGRLSFGGVQTTTFSPEDLLLILSMHGAKHWWLRLQWICDVAQLLRCCPAQLSIGVAVGERFRAHAWV